MATYTVKLAGETKAENVIADEFQVDENGNLIFWNKAGDHPRRTSVFATNQWQFMKEEN
jgi:hypothetical protein